jgi:hypothetical protein
MLGIMPSTRALTSRSTRNQRGNCVPILATVHLYRILQLVVFLFCPCPRTSSRPVDAGVLPGLPGTMPSTIALVYRAIQNQRGDCTPILGTVHVYRILQLVVFVFRPAPQHTYSSLRVTVAFG